MENRRKPLHESHGWANDNEDPGGQRDIALRELFVTFVKIPLKQWTTCVLTTDWRSFRLFLGLILQKKFHVFASLTKSHWSQNNIQDTIWRWNLLMIIYKKRPSRIWYSLFTLILDTSTWLLFHQKFLYVFTIMIDGVQINSEHTYIVWIQHQTKWNKSIDFLPRTNISDTAWTSVGNHVTLTVRKK